MEFGLSTFLCYFCIAIVETQFLKINDMKKLFLMVLVALMTTANLNAQTMGDVVFRFRGGGNLSTLTGNDDAKQKIGWSLGLGLDYYLTDQIALGIDVSHDNIGAKSKSLDKSLKLEYFSAGPMARYYVAPWLALECGTEVGLLLKAKLDDEKCKGDYKKVEVSLPVGLSFEPKLGNSDMGLVIDLRYRFGLSTVNKKDVLPDDMKNSAVILTIGYKLKM